MVLLAVVKKILVTFKINLDYNLKFFYIIKMNKTNCSVNMVLTSIVNNKSILKDIVSDIKERFKVNVNEEKLEAFLSTVDVEVKQNVTLV